LVRGNIPRIWMRYRAAVGEYLVNRMHELEKEIKSGDANDPNVRKAFEIYKNIVNNYVKRIKESLTKSTGIYTKAGPHGPRTEFVHPEAAKLLGVYKPPQDLVEEIKRQQHMTAQTAPIMDVLTKDLNSDKMASAIFKVRKAFKMLTDEDPNLKKLLADMDLMSVRGKEALKAWDFDKLVKGITNLREALQNYHRLSIGGLIGNAEEYTGEARKNVEDMLKYLSQMEKMFTPTAGESAMGMRAVPTFLSPRTQEVLHRRNIVAAEEFYKKSREEGGPAIGKAYTYKYKIVDPSTKQVLSNIAVEFNKIGEAATKSGRKIGLFTEHTEDLIKLFQTRRGFGQAFSRVIRWGVASRTVYGLVSALKDMVSTITEVEFGMAQLQKVMNPLTSNFNEIRNAAISFAKDFGLPITKVIESMRVFAQQGLSQKEVLDRTKVSALAANVTTLNAADATEALTAAMKSYNSEGSSAIKFLDAWNEVESRNAVTAKDLALALMKVGPAARTAGVSFDELNGLITAIASTTRQTGREVGTSLRYMFRQLQGTSTVRKNAAPKTLATVGIPIFNQEGALKPVTRILDELHDKWNDLTTAQKLNIAQAIGGRRHYNSLIVLMDHWDEALKATEESLNSKGAAERRNAIVMETYRKKLEQLKASIAGLQISFGKIALPVAKTVVTAVKGLLDAFSDIPGVLKAVMLGLSGFFILLSKGGAPLKTFITRIKAIPTFISSFTSSFKKEIGTALYEVFGKTSKFIKPEMFKGLTQVANAKGIEDMTSVLGKFAYMLTNVGRKYNLFLSDMMKGGESAFGKLSEWLSGLSGFFAKGGALAALAGKPIMGAASEVGALAMSGLAAPTELTSLGFGKAGSFFNESGLAGSSMAKSIIPMVASITAAIPAIKKLYKEYKKLTFSAEDYAKSLHGLITKQDNEIAEINKIISNYDKLSDKLEKSKAKISKPLPEEKLVEQIQRKTYKSPLLEQARTQREIIKLSNEVATELKGYNTSLIEGFDSLGNAIISVNKKTSTFFNNVKRAKLSDSLNTQLDILKKHITDLTEIGGIEKTKDMIKSLAKEFPGKLVKR